MFELDADATFRSWGYAFGFDFSLVIGWTGAVKSSLSESPIFPKASTASLLLLRPNGGHNDIGSGACGDMS